MTKIVISYRREDTAGVTGRIDDRLRHRYGASAVFRDIDSKLQIGRDFRPQINQALNDADVLLCIIGGRWLGPRDSGANRIMDRTDFVRLEVETAIGRDIPVVPILIDGTEMPGAEDLPDSLQDFRYRQAVTISQLRDFDVHVQRLLDALDGVIGDPAVAAAGAAPPNDRATAALATHEPGHEPRHESGHEPPQRVSPPAQPQPVGTDPQPPASRPATAAARARVLPILVGLVAVVRIALIVEVSNRINSFNLMSYLAVPKVALDLLALILVPVVLLWLRSPPRRWVGFVAMLDACICAYLLFDSLTLLGRATGQVLAVTYVYAAVRLLGTATMFTLAMGILRARYAADRSATSA